MRKSKIYFFSAKNLNFTEARWFKTKLIGCGFVVGIIIAISLISINQQYGDIFGIGFIHQSSLANENRVLQDQLKFLTHRLEAIQKNLASIGDKGNELRLLSNLPAIDDDIRKAGVGGTDMKIDFTASLSVNSLINNIRNTMWQVDREIKMQASSYDEIEKAYQDNQTKFAHLPAIKPMAGFYKQGDFGSRFHPLLHYIRPHEGIDIINEVGTPIYAPADGTILETSYATGYGLNIKIDHGYSVKTIFAHLSKVLVKEGQKVKRGDIIGRCGSSGLSTGPHLHYEVRVNGVAQNPINYFFDDITPEDYINQK